MTALEGLMADAAAYLVDIRLSPRSQYKPEFNKSALEKQFPKRYVHIPELGNLNYRPEATDTSRTISKMVLKMENT